jgi:CHAT domain-containing protein/Tfp pilus assembly protein PilF
MLFFWSLKRLNRTLTFRYIFVVSFFSVLLMGLFLQPGQASAAEEQAGDARRLIERSREKELAKKKKASGDLRMAKQVKLDKHLNAARSLTRSKQYHDALKVYRQALSLQRDIKDSAGEAGTWAKIGELCYLLGDYAQSINAFANSITIRRTLNDPKGLARVLVNIGVVHFDQSRYARAIEFYEEASALYERSGYAESKASGIVLNNLALTYTELGQYTKALKLYERVLPIFEKTEDIAATGTALHNTGFLYAEQNDNPRALQYYERALKARTEIKDTRGIASTLNNMGYLYSREGNVEKAIELLHQALSLSREYNERSIEGRTLDSVGDAYVLAKKYPEALAAYNKALVIRSQLGDRRGERITLANIGGLLQKQGRYSLAIPFYKKAVNVSESIRGEMGGLSSEIRVSYATRVSEVYRRLADLLLKYDRVFEAQQVMDLLKLHEIEDYLRGVRGNERTSQGIVRLPGEKQMSGAYDEMIKRLMVTDEELRKLKSSSDSLTAAEQEQLDALISQLKQLSSEFDRFLESDEIREWEESMTRTEHKSTLELDMLLKLQDNLKKLQKAILLYPLVLEDRLELIFVTSHGPPVHLAVPIKRTELNKLIDKFRTVLRDVHADAKPLAWSLYNILIKPIEPWLGDAGSILYAPDRALRYIPLSALYDGKQWMTERFAIHRITAYSLSDLNAQPSGELRVLAGAFSAGTLDFSVGEEKFHFSGLPFARAEVENLAKTIATTKTMFDRDFSPEKTEKEAGGHTVIHLATHASFLAGQPDESFILFGNGERLTLIDVKSKWPGLLRDVELVVLSACETGIGGRLGTGDEILGFGYLMERAGAEATIATLWAVDDGGTQILMNAFYNNLFKKGTTKAEALRQAQLTLIKSNDKTGVDNRGVISGDGLHTLKGILSHPYYWAPFMLIGNGL